MTTDLTTDQMPPPANATKPWILRVLFAMYIAGLFVFCIFQRKVLFAWPLGIVTGNLLASAIWAPLAVIHLDQLARRHHREHLALIHKHHREHMAAIEKVC
jgi:hypothetical protein